MDWVDKRQPLSREALDFDQLEGVLCNVVTSSFFRAMWEQRHWFAVRKVPFRSEAQFQLIRLDDRPPPPCTCGLYRSTASSTISTPSYPIQRYSSIY